VALDLGISKVVRSEAGSKREKKEQVFVRVTAANQVYLNDKEIPTGSLKSALETTFKGKTGEPLFFEADPLADYPEVVRILDEVSAAGVQNVAIVQREKSRSSPAPPR
jgi:biopolymer transport protein ExbD